MEVDKIDLSLDDIIKLNKKQAKANSLSQYFRGQGRGRGRGRGGRGRGSLRGGSLGSNRGQRGGQGRGTLIFRRGGAITAVRGRNRYSPVNKGTSPLSRLNSSTGTTQQTNRGRLRGRERGIRGRIGLRGQGRLRLRGQGQRRLQGQRGGLSGTGFTSLNRRREQAIQSLLRAKQTLAKINARQQAQKQNRSQLVNQRRGLQSSTTSLNRIGQSRGRGRGRGRGNQGSGRLSRFGSTLSISSVGSQRRGRGQGQQGLNRSFSGSTVSINSVGYSKNNRGRRRWRQPNTSQSAQSSVLTISVPNSPPPQPRRRNKLPRYNVNGPDSNPELQAQIRNLKPAVSTKYNFKKSVFAQATTSTSLSDRFSASQNPRQQQQQQQTDHLGRKVFF